MAAFVGLFALVSVPCHVQGEGTFVLKHRGRDYMTYSANRTGFPHDGVGYATADRFKPADHLIVL